MNQLALLHWRQGRLNDAEPLSREAYDVGLQLLDRATLTCWRTR